MVIDDRMIRTVVARRELHLRDRHADRIGDALPQWPGGDLHARGMSALGMPRRLAAPLAELFDVVQRQVVTGQMQQAVEQHRAVPRREHKTIAIDPLRIARIVLEQSCPQRIRHWRGTEWHARMPAVGFLHGVHREEANRVDALLIELVCHG